MTARDLFIQIIVTVIFALTNYVLKNNAEIIQFHIYSKSRKK